jgi:ubiquitin-protein ligase
LTIPRKFKLLEEYENATHGKGDPSCSYGLEDRFFIFILADDMEMVKWNATIIGPQGVYLLIHFYITLLLHTIIVIHFIYAIVFILI